jgi:hypothetical protein
MKSIWKAPARPGATAALLGEFPAWRPEPTPGAGAAEVPRASRRDLSRSALVTIYNWIRRA